MSRGFRGFLAQTILKLVGSQLNPFKKLSLNIYLGRYNLNLQRENKFDFLKTHGNNLKS